MSSGLVIYYLIGALAIVFVSVLVYRLSLRREKELNWKWLGGFVLAGALFLPIAQLLKFGSLGMYVDFAHWLGVLESIRATGLPLSLSHEFIFPGTENYFSVHFTPLLYVIALPFLVIPKPQTLIIMNALMMLSSAVPLYLLAKHLLKKTSLAWFAVALLLWYPTFQYITLYEFEMLRFSIPLLLWMLYFWETKRTPWFFVFAALACLVREEVGLTVFMFGVYALVRDRARWKGALTMLLGLGAFLVITGGVMPALREGDYVAIAAGSFSAFGTTPLEILRGIVLHPRLFFGTVFSIVKIANIGMLFLPLLGLSFAAPSALIGMLANVGVGLLSEADVHSSYMLYYVAPSVPFVFYGLLKGWLRAQQWIGKILARDASQTRQEYALARTVLTSVIVSAIFFGPSFLSLQFWFQNIQPAPFRTQNFHFTAYRITDHHRLAQELIDMIPNDAIVSSQQFLAPRLYEKRGTMVFPDLYSKDGRYEANYALIDVSNNGLSPESPAYVTLEEMHYVTQDKDWELVSSSNDGYLLYVRVSDM